MRSVLRDRYQLALSPAPELRPEITQGNLLPEIDPEPNYVIAHTQRCQETADHYTVDQ
jgi:hypothetical protein